MPNDSRIPGSPTGEPEFPWHSGAFEIDGKVLSTECWPLVEFWREFTAHGVLDIFTRGA